MPERLFYKVLFNNQVKTKYYLHVQPKLSYCSILINLHSKFLSATKIRINVFK